MKPDRPPRRIKPNGALYRKRLNEQVQLYMPPLVDCKACGSPRHRSFICQYCGKE